MKEDFEQASELLRTGKFQNAIVAFDAYLSKNAKHSEAYYLRGLAKFYSENYEAALIDFDLALKLNPYMPDVISQRGVTKFHLKKLHEALQDMDAAANLEPQNGYRFSSRAYIKASLGDIEGAIDDYKNAINLDPEDAISYNNMGLLEEQLGYKTKAQKNFEKADELSAKTNNEILQAPNNPSEEELITKEEFDALLKENLSPENLGEVAQKSSDKQPNLLKKAQIVFSSKSNFSHFWQFVKSKF